MPASKIKILLIEDSGFMRIFLSDILRKDMNIDVIATAVNGREGVEKVKALKPDVVITDMVMPQYDGLYVVQQLMKDMPLPIILLSSLDRNDPKIFDALCEGAFDFIDKPLRDENPGGYQRLTSLIREASMTDYLKLQQRAHGRNLSVHTFEAQLQYDIIVIGASTGGPGAVEFMISNLPRNLVVPVIIAQHMPERFIESFATRLTAATGMKISVARNGEPLLAGHIYLAPGTANLQVDISNGSPVFRYINDHYKEYNNPSVDSLFESVSAGYGARAIGVILTGMGKDGATGLKKMRAAGALTIAQDEPSSVVYGMPKVAVEIGAALYQLPLAEIPPFIISAL